ncbi:heparinase [Enterococcus faecalis]|nr:heparinase [Enterococcus faecalis]
MNLQRIEDYQLKFFQQDWLSEYLEQQSQFLKPLFERTSYLLKDQIIYNDAMDMEACSIPYSLKEYAWNRYPDDDPEWLFMLSRQSFLVDLAQAYALTKKERYLQKWHSLLIDFINDEGEPNSTNRDVWRPLDVGIRVTNWMKSLTYIPIADFRLLGIDDVLNNALLIHLDYLERSYIDKYRLSNWGVLAIGGMAAIDLFLPELVTSKQRDLIWSRLAEQLDLQFYSDGIHWEQSPLYQHEVLMTFVYLLQISEYLEVQLPLDLRMKLKTPIFSTHYLADNQDILNPINDSDHVNFHYVYDIYRKLGFIFEPSMTANMARLWTGDLYEERIWETMKPKELFRGESSGLMAYKAEDIYFTLFNGLHGSAHGHASTGGFTLQLQGDDLFSDSGRYSYVNKSERLQLKECASHNTMFIAENPHTLVSDTWGYDKLPTPLFQQIKELSVGFFAECGWLDKADQNPMIFERSFIYLKSINSVVIIDSFAGQKETEITSTYNLAPSINCQKEAHRFALTTNKHKYTLLFAGGQTQQSVAKGSEIYNQLNEHPRLSNKFCYKTGKEIQATVISPLEDIQITPIKVSQTGENEQFCQAKGFRIIAGSEKFDLIVMREDIVKGNKLLVSEYGQFFYGRLVLIDQKEAKIRIK